MQNVEKKTRRSLRHGRIWLLLLLIGCLAAALLSAQELGKPADVPTVSLSTAQDLFSYAPEDVLSLTISRKGEESWTVQRNTDGLFVMQEEEAFVLSENATRELAEAACIIPCEAVLADTASEYAAHLADYGLTEPEYQAIITYADGVTASLTIGQPALHDPAWSYMLVEGDERLFSFSRDMIETLFVSRESLRDVTQPVIHKSRIDRLTLRGSDGQIQQEWTLQGDIAQDDAMDRWQLTCPFPYPADATAMETMLANASNLRLGAYVAPATAEHLTQYGFDSPRLTIEIHMAAGTIGNVNMNGEFITADWPEGTVTLVIGDAKSDMVDYVRFEDHVYLSSHFTMGVFMNIDVRSTLTRYPVLTALGNLAELTIDEDGSITRYVLTRTEQVAPNNDLVLDADGRPVYDIICTCNGTPIDYEAFKAAYSSLMMTTVSGTIPVGEQVSGTPHTIYTFLDVDGTQHTVALSTFDVLHDAVSVDGQQLFYLIKGGFQLGLE